MATLTEVTVEGAEKLDAALNVCNSNGLTNTVHGPARDANIYRAYACERCDGWADG